MEARAIADDLSRPILDEIHNLLLSATNGRVKLRIDIEGECPEGFTEQTLRALRENSTSLGVDAEFDQ